MILEARRFVLIGAGGVGGWLAQMLAMTAEHQCPGSVLLIVDGDNFEPKNKERQLFTEYGNKAIAKAEELQPQYPKTYIVGDHRWVVADDKQKEGDETTIAASELIQEGDVVYAVVDNFAARAAVFDAAEKLDNVDVFTGGNDEKFFVSTYHYQKRDGQEITEHPGEYHPELRNPPDRNPGELSCQERSELQGGAQTIAANAGVATLLHAQTCKYILDGDENKGCEVMADLGEGVASSRDRRVSRVEATV